ncbi:hypothetical protein [Hufsiella ginkgonis]|uniref:Uncharacterized protein n=1 Tax=Hufsiella ginkgonis TaxID=2695274 RepID=A0A7K1Y2G8_9SPHI|nr:hypothetical protein [Hufsiella ginkgonis]MXV16876.1 hypothetical protein [Hufsiella ginkgonis]
MEKKPRVLTLPPGFKPGDKLIVPHEMSFRIEVRQSDMKKALANGELGDFFTPDLPGDKQLN